MNTGQYSYLTLFWKVLAAALSVIAPGQAALEALPADVDTFTANWIVYVGGALWATYCAGRNLYKNRDLDGNPIPSSKQPPSQGDGSGATSIPALLAPLLAPFLLLAAGCATSVTTKFSETVYDENNNPATTLYEVKSRGDVEKSMHEFVYKYGGEENVIAVGQSAEGVTSPAQTDAIRALLSLPPDVLRSLIPFGTNTGAADGK